MADERKLSIPTNKENESESKEVVKDKEVEETKEEPKEENKEEKPLTKEESEYIEKVFFEEDESVMLRDGKSYKIPPLGLKDAKNLMKKLNSIDTGVIIANLMEGEEGDDSYDELLDVLLMAFKPYYKEVTLEYLEEYIDITTAKDIIDIMIGLNGIKKSL